MKEKVIEEFKKIYPSVFEWKDEPGFVYPSHHHKGKVSMYIVSGQVTFTSGIDKTLKAGDFFDPPVGVEHTAVVGPDGCEYIVGEEIEGDA